MHIRVCQKKLEIVAARLFGKQAKISSDVLDDMRAFGASQESIKKAEKEIEKSQTIEVTDCNMEAVKLFLACQLQRLVTPTGQIIYDGVKRESIPTVAKMAGLPEVTPDTFSRFQVLEFEAVKVLNKN